TGPCRPHRPADARDRPDGRERLAFRPDDGRCDRPRRSKAYAARPAGAVGPRHFAGGDWLAYRLNFPKRASSAIGWAIGDGQDSRRLPPAPRDFGRYRGLQVAPPDPAAA